MHAGNLIIKAAVKQSWNKTWNHITHDLYVQPNLIKIIKKKQHWLFVLQLNTINIIVSILVFSGKVLIAVKLQGWPLWNETRSCPHVKHSEFQPASKGTWQWPKVSQYQWCCLHLCDIIFRMGKNSVQQLWSREIGKMWQKQLCRH